MQQVDGVAAFGLVEIGGRPQHADTLADQGLDHRPQLTARHRIDADARLVEQQQPWLFQESAGETELLLHSARKLAGQPRLEALEIGELEQPVEARLARLADQAAQVGIEVEVFPHGQVFVKSEALRHIADLGAVGLERRLAQNDDLAGVGFDQSGQNADHRRLAGAVRSDQAGHSTRLDH